MGTVRIERCPDCNALVGEGHLYEHQQKQCPTPLDPLPQPPTRERFQCQGWDDGTPGCGLIAVDEDGNCIHCGADTIVVQAAEPTAEEPPQEPPREAAMTHPQTLQEAITELQMTASAYDGSRLCLSIHHVLEHLDQQAKRLTEMTASDKRNHERRIAAELRADRAEAQLTEMTKARDTIKAEHELYVGAYQRLGDAATSLEQQRNAAEAKAQQLEADRAALVGHIKHFLGPDFGTPPSEHEQSFLVHSINHLGGLKQDYVIVARALEEQRKENTALREQERQR